MQQVSLAQSNTSTSFISQLAAVEGKSTSIIINIVNESHVREQFVVKPRQSHATSSGITIKTWYGQSWNSPSRSVHIAHSDKTIAARITTPTASYHLSSNKDIYRWSADAFSQTPGDGCLLQGMGLKGRLKGEEKASSVSDLLEYKIALTATPQFSAIHGNTRTDVLIALMGYINQVNTIYERELGIRLKLVDDSEKLIFLDGQPDPFSNQVGLAVSENIQILGDSIGLSNYDVGHLLRLGGGGLASIEVACTPNKGFGVSGLENAANFHLLLAHEIGHQLGAGHTWNSCSATLNEIQRSPSSAMEPGSGNTIMGYAGLCGANNVANLRESYFHAISIDQIRTYSRNGTGSSCPQVLSEPNTPPSILNVSSTEKAIPKSTPFILSGDAVDAEGDILTHGWDQIDQDDAVNLGIETLYNPTIRSQSPSINPDRHIPNLVDLANGIEDQSELLPTLQRALEFRYIVRDNHSGNGNISWVDFQLQTDTSAGPFVIKDDGINTWFANGIHPIEWDIANTNNAAVDCQLVDILIDYDGLLAFQDTLAHNILNDGLHYAHVPDTVSENARIMVRAADNIFFDMSTAFPIRRTGGQDFQIYTDTTALVICNEPEVVYKIQSRSINGFFNPIRYTVGTLPEGLSASLSDNDLTPGFIIDLKITLARNTDRGEYIIPIEAFAVNGTTQTLNFTLRVTQDDLNVTVLNNPIDGDMVDTTSPTFTWESDPSTSKNIIQIATSPTFEQEDILIEDSTSLSQLRATLTNKGSYFWRILSKNDCSTLVKSQTQSFGIKEINCNSFTNSDPLSISSGIDSISSSINVPIDEPIQSIQLTNIKGNHSYIGDLTFVLISPSGQRFRLLENECNESKNFDLGISDSSDRLRCNINRGLSYKPINDFESLKGVSSQGEWLLRIIDNVPGDGGQLKGWQLNICSFDNPSNPSLINSDTLKLQPGKEAIVDSSILEYQDQDNSATEIRYIITVQTSKGHLVLGTDTLRLGDSFSQGDINNQELRYIHKNAAEEIDILNYVVTDGAGFSSPIQQLIIAIQTNVSTISLEETFGITIFPNPVEDVLYIDGLSEIDTDISVKLYQIDGRLVSQLIINKNNTSNQWDLSSAPNGIYLLNMTTTKTTASQKIIIQR